MLSVQVRDCASGDMTLLFHTKPLLWPTDACGGSSVLYWTWVSLSFSDFPCKLTQNAIQNKRLSTTDFTSLRLIILSKQYEAVVLSSVANLHLNIYKMLMFLCCKLQYSSLFSEEPSLNCLPYLLARFSGSIMLTSLCRFQTELT